MLVLGWIRAVGIWIDSIAYGLIDNLYNLIDVLAKAELFDETAIVTIMKNTYVVISIFALFRIALLLVNAIINPDKLNDKENGITSVLRNLIIMFALLIFTPLLFKEAYSIQSTIVGGNYVSKIFTGGNVTTSGNPGKTMQRIAIKALIYPNEKLATQDSNGKYVATDDCGSKCEDAIEAYNDNILSGDEGLWSTLTKYIGTTEKVDGEKEFVYTYTFLVTFIVGLVMTYIIASMALDIAIRAVELAILQIIAPLFIVTYIDPKSAKSGPFHNWLKTVGSTYASLFIKLAILELMIMLIGLIPSVNFEGLGFWGTLLILLAILIFAKKAPKWIGDMIGVSSESTGIGGLGKKLGSAALVGGALTKAGHAAAGLASGAMSAAHLNAKDRRANRKAIREEKGLTHGKKGRETRKGYSGGYFQQRKQLHADRKAAYKAAGYDAKSNLKKGLASGALGAISGISGGVSAENLKGSFKAGLQGTNKIASRLSLTTDKGILNRIGGKIKGLPGKMEKAAYGTPNELLEKRENRDKMEKALKWTEKGDSGIQNFGIGKGSIAVGQKDANTICDAIATSNNLGKLDMASYNAVQYAINQGYATVSSTGKIDLSKVEFDASSGNFNFKNSKGEVITTKTSDELSKNCAGIIDSSSTGSVEQEKMINNYQSTSLNNYQQNEQLRAQEIASYSNAKAESNKIVDDLMSAVARFDSGHFLSVKLDSSSLENLKTSIETALNDAKIKSDAKEIDETTYNALNFTLNRYNDEINRAETFEEAAKLNYENLQEIVKAQTELKNVVDSISGSTISEKLNSIALAEKKISDKLSALSDKGKDDK